MERTVETGVVVVGGGGAGLMAADILGKNGHRSDPDVTLALRRRSVETIHWLVDGIGVDLEFAPKVT